jgi:glycine dehydrogenase subunit 1
MPYVPHTDDDKKKMLEKIGVEDLSGLLEPIPPSLRLKGKLNLPEPLPEMELVKLLNQMAEENRNLNQTISFLGAGAYDHFIPSVINHIISRSEFYTAYTPYQAEVSQGTLQAIYEFQSLICQLTGMDVANASMYDGASAVAEAALMAHAHTNREVILVADSINHHYRVVLDTYANALPIEIKTIPLEDGLVDINYLEKRMDEKVAGLIVQSPNLFGLLENIEKVEPIVHSKGGLLIMVCDPISLGILKSPGDYNVDIALGEGQGMGIPLSFGGPYLGFFAAKQELIRRMPGRIVGETVDSQDRRGYVLTLQTREQHIRREKATSNICTNEALCALASAVYLSLMGKEGLRKVAELCLQKSHYAFEQICEIKGFKPGFTASFFKEFVIQTPIPPREIIDSLSSKNIFAGVDLNRFGIKMGNALLVCVTEKRTKEEIDYFVSELKKSA